MMSKSQNCRRMRSPWAMAASVGPLKGTACIPAAERVSMTENSSPANQRLRRAFSWQMVRSSWTTGPGSREASAPRQAAAMGRRPWVSAKRSNRAESRGWLTRVRSRGVCSPADAVARSSSHSRDITTPKRLRGTGPADGGEIAVVISFPERQTVRAWTSLQVDFRAGALPGKPYNTRGFEIARYHECCGFQFGNQALPAPPRAVQLAGPGAKRGHGGFAAGIAPCAQGRSAGSPGAERKWQDDHPEAHFHHADPRRGRGCHLWSGHLAGGWDGAAQGRVRRGQRALVFPPPYGAREPRFFRGARRRDQARAGGQGRGEVGPDRIGGRRGYLGDEVFKRNVPAPGRGAGPAEESRSLAAG